MTEYVPAALTVRTASVLLSFQRSVPLPSAVRLTLGELQVSVALDGSILTQGGAVSLKTVVVAVLTQPLAALTLTEQSQASALAYSSVDFVDGIPEAVLGNASCKVTGKGRFFPLVGQ